MASSELVTAAGERSRQKKARRPRGQAMLEYSLVAHMTLIGGALLLLPVLNQLLNAITLFYTSIYTVIQSAAV